MSPFVAAIELARAVIADSSTVADLVARIDNLQTERSARADAMLALALAANDGVTMPDEVFELLDDDLLLDALLAANASAAITGLAAAAGDRITAAQRRYLAARVGSAEAGGTHVAALHLVAGDLIAGAVAAAAALVEGTRGRSADDPWVIAIAQLVSSWADAHGSAFADAIAVRLPDSTRILLTAAIRSVDTRPDLPFMRALERSD